MATITTPAAGVSPYQESAAAPTVLRASADGTTVLATAAAAATTVSELAATAANTLVVVNGEAALNSLIATSRSGVFDGANVTINLEEQNFNTTNQVTSTTNYADGANGSIQYNNGDNGFAGDAYFTYTNSNVVTPGIRTNGYFYGNGAPFTGGGNAAIGNFVFSGDTITISDVNQVMSITGNGTGNVQVTSNTNVWTFDNDGNLTLPSNTSSINYANGSPYGSGGNYSNSNVSSFLAAFGSNVVSTTGNITGGNLTTTGTANIASLAVTGSATVQGSIGIFSTSTSLSATGNIIVGNILTGGLISATGNITGNYFIGNGSELTGIIANTGNVTFSSEIVIGTGTSNLISGLYLAPSSSSANANMYLRVRGNIVDEPTHIHFDTGNNSYYNQFIGDDNKYIQLANTGNIVINSNDVAGNAAQWTFAADGNLSLPADATISDYDNTASLNVEGSDRVAQLYWNGNIGNGNPDEGGDYYTWAYVHQNGFTIQYENANTSTDNEWRFDIDGNITLPTGTPSINYANGSPYGGGGANTGNVTFDDQVVIGTGDGSSGSGGLYLAPGLDSTANLQYLRVSGGDVASHIHLDTGNNEYFDLYIGTDSRSVKIANTGNIDINTNDGSGNSASWTFAANGNLTFPTGNLVITPDDPAGNVAVIASTDHPLAILSTGANGSTATFWVEDYANFGTSNIAAVYVNPVSQTGNVQIQTGNNSSITAWNFTPDGNLTLPNGAVIKDTVGNAVAFGRDAAATGPQGNAAVAIGQQAGETSQGASSVAIGYQAGLNTQGANAVAIGVSAGQSTQQVGAVAVGLNAGTYTQGQNAVAIGSRAGNTSQQTQSVAIGVDAAADSQGQNSVAIGSSAAAGSQGEKAVAIGLYAGNTTQGNSSVAIGDNAGYDTQGANSVAIGSYAGQSAQGNNSIIINATGAGLNALTANTFTVAPVRNDVSNIAEIVFYNATSNEITYGNTISVAGNVSTPIVYSQGMAVEGYDFVQMQYSNAVALPISPYDIGTGSWFFLDPAGATWESNTTGTLKTVVLGNDGSVSAVGNITGGNLSAINLVINSITSDDSTFVTIEDGVNITTGSISSQENLSLTANAQTWTFRNDGVGIVLPGGAAIRDTSGGSLAIGVGAGALALGNTAVAVGYQAAFLAQGNNSVAIGRSAGETQGEQAVAIGLNAGRSQGNYAVAIGKFSANSSQGEYSVAIGPNAGFENQLSNAVSIGSQAGASSQGINSVAVGVSAAYLTQGNNAVAVGNSAGYLLQGNNSVAIGDSAGIFYQGNYSVAVGYLAGNNTQGGDSVAVGVNSGGQLQGTEAVAVGSYAGYISQGNLSVAVGRGAGENSQGANSVAVGHLAGRTNQGNNSIILNATGANLEQTTANTFTVAPVRNDVANIAEVMFYNTTSKEITYGNTISVAGNITGNYFIGNGAALTDVGVASVPGQNILPTIQTITISATSNGGTGGGTGWANVTVANTIPVTEYGVIITAGTVSQTYATGALGSIPGTVQLTITTGLNTTPFTVYAYVTSNAGTYYSNSATGTSGICLLAGTQIALSDGTHKAIEDITYTDKLLSWDFDRGCYAETTAMWIKRSETGSQYNLLTFSDGTTLRTFDQHRIFNKQAGAFTYPMTAETPVGTVTVNEHGQEITLTNKQVIQDTIEYYNVITDYHMNLFSDSVLTSCRFNNIYPIVDMKFAKDGRTLRTRAEFENVEDRFFHGLRLAEQTADIETVEWYVNRLLSTEVSTHAELAV